MIKLGLLSQRVGPIGIDLGSSRICACQLTGRRGRGLSAAVELTRRGPDPLAEIPRLVRVMARRGFRTAPVVVGIADAETTVAELSLPLAERDAPISDIVAAQLGKLRQALPNTLETCWWATQPISAGGATRSLAVALATSVGERVTEAFGTAGVTVAAIEPRPIAIARWCRPLVRTGLQVVVEVDINRAQMIVLEQGLVSYVRPLAWHDGHSEIGAAPTDGVPLEAFLSDLRLSLGYLSHRHMNVAIDRLLLVGANANDPAIAEAIRASFEMETVVVSPDQYLALQRGPQATAGPATLAALGLAAREEDERCAA